MVEDFTQMTNNLIEQIDSKWTLNSSDRCDSCGSQAYVQALGTAGDLLFCAHHYQGILDNEKAQEAMTQFAYQIVDERDRLIENKLKDEDYR
jgi:hypothetical protein